MIALEVSVCDQRRSYIARFANADQAIEFIHRRLPSSGNADPALVGDSGYGNHAFHELQDEPLIPEVGPVNEDVLRLLEILYPHCEHGLSLDLCMGPDHYLSYEQERAMGW